MFEVPAITPTPGPLIPTDTDHARGITFYWEHLGMLDDPGYCARWARKRAEYVAAGILPVEDGGGAAGTLIETRDDPGGGLDAGKIAKTHRRNRLGMICRRIQE